MDGPGLPAEPAPDQGTGQGGDGASRGWTIRTVQSMDEVAPEAWERCANPPDLPWHPFVSHAFLKALEESGSAIPERGWLPYHLLLESGDGVLEGAMPLYVKGHSQGEYVFDHGWAQAFERAGGQYYPKLLCAVPFTPVTGRRALVARPELRTPLAGHLARGSVEIARRLELSSAHYNFLEEPLWHELGRLGFLQRTDQQFHWFNGWDPRAGRAAPGATYRDFDDFLAALSSRKRKNLRRERRSVGEAGLEVDWVTGPDLREAHWDAFFEFYMDTGSRKWGTPYLTRSFFSLVGEAMPERILLVLARRGRRYVAGALNFIGDDALYGRYWGATEHHPFLHFELCYYQAIEFAIARGLAWVEAGAQGAHKVARGYLPVQTRSAHWIGHEGLRRAVERYLRDERRYVAEEMDLIAGHAPFRRDGPAPGDERQPGGG